MECKILFSDQSGLLSRIARFPTEGREYSYSFSATQNSMFYSMKNSRLSCRKLPVANEKARLSLFPEFQNKRTISYWWFLFHLTFLPEFLMFFVEWFAFCKFSNFQVWSEPRQSRIKLCSVKQNLKSWLVIIKSADCLLWE